jgi:hypothetical protein
MLRAEIGYKGHDADDNEINTNQVIEYFGENYNNNTENDAGYGHPQTQGRKRYS